MLKKLSYLLFVLCVGVFFSSTVFAGQGVRVGVGLPTGLYGQYEYKVLLDQVGIFGNIGTLDGTINSNKVRVSSWALGARYYLPLGFHVQAGLSSITVDGTATDSVTNLSVDVQGKATGIDLGLGYEIGLGPVFVGLDGGAILAKPTFTTSAPNAITGGVMDSFNASSIPYLKACLGVKLQSSINKRTPNTQIGRPNGRPIYLLNNALDVF